MKLHASAALAAAACCCPLGSDALLSGYGAARRLRAVVARRSAVDGDGDASSHASSTPRSAPQAAPSGLTVAVLKAECRARGLKVSGSKAELVARLLAAVKGRSAAAPPSSAAAAPRADAEHAAAAAVAVVAVAPPRKPQFVSLNAADRASASKPAERIPYSDEEDEEHQVSYDTYDAYRDDYGVAGSTLRQVAHDYNFPLEFCLSSAVQLGLPPPVDCDTKLSQLMSGDQVFALVEALTTIDPAEAHDRFVDQRLDEVAEDFGVPLARAFAICAELSVNLPMGVRTHLRVDEHRLLVEELELETGVTKAPSLDGVVARPGDVVSGWHEREGDLAGFHRFDNQGLASKSATAAQVPRELLKRGLFKQPPETTTEGKDAGPPPPDFSY